MPLFALIYCPYNKKSKSEELNTLKSGYLCSGKGIKIIPCLIYIII